MFTHLFSPIQIGTMQLKNRLILSGINVNYAAEDGSVTERLRDFYVERARGGVGMVQTGICYVDPLGRFFTNQMGIHDDRLIPGLRRLVDEVHAYGAALVVQLCHVGRYASSEIIGAQAVAPSAIPSRLTHEMPRELTVREIKDIIEAFAQGARRARDAGADAVDLAGSVGYLISQFLSPYTNKRTDEYGGSVHQRMRFTLDIIERIKQVAGKDYPIMYRISGDEFLPGGNTLEDTKIIAQDLEKAGVASINVIPGWHESPVPLVSYHVPPGQYVYLAEEFKKVLHVPVIASNRINTPVLAEEIIAQGKADLVTMARALIADPELPNKAAAGRLEDIRPCIACNQGCYDRLFADKDIVCLANPAAGREKDYEIKPAEKPRKILVIGGGPAGMEAARVARLRGHDVTLWERNDRLGGQLNLALMPPTKHEIINLVEHLSCQVVKLGVKVELRKEATTRSIGEFGPEAVIVATGAKPIVPPIPGVQGDHVVTAHDVLSGKAVIGERIILVGGGQVGIETADLLAGQGKQVTIVEMLEKIGADIGITTRWIAMKRLVDQGVRTLTGSKALEITPTGLTVEKNGEKRFMEADTVIMAVGSCSERQLLDGPLGTMEVYAVGDCVKPRKALEAIQEGANIALRL